MGTLRIGVIDPSQSENTKMEVPDDVRVEELVEAMAEAMLLPAHGPNGQPNRYQLNLRHFNGQLTRLDGNRTLTQNGVQQNALLQLTVEMVAGPEYPPVVPHYMKLEVSDPWQAKTTTWIAPVGTTIGEFTSCVVDALPSSAPALNTSTRYQLNIRERD